MKAIDAPNPETKFHFLVLALLIMVLQQVQSFLVSGQNNHNIIFNLMLTAVVANLVSNFISKHSFYDHLKDQYLSDLKKEDAPDLKKLKVPL